MEAAAPEYHTLIRDMPAEERPRERLRLRGPESLSNAELIAILLRTGANGENVVNVATRILSTFEGLPGLGRVSFGQLAQQHAIGVAKASQLLAAIELGKRVLHAQPQERRVIRAPEDVYAMLFAEVALLEQEHLKVMLLTARNEVVAVKDVYKGSVNNVVIRLGEVFRDAVREGCSSIIAVHNHPSGDPSPSNPDVILTKQLVEAGRLLGIEVLDHIVIARQGFVSMKNQRLGFEPQPAATALAAVAAQR
jgi:DNA repair protein RadC